MSYRWAFVSAAVLVVAAGVSCASPTRVSITLRDHAFEPKDLVVNAGEVEFALNNVGAEPHDFSIAETTGPLIAKSEKIEPGNKGVLATKLKPGRYQIYCSVAPHRQLGMEGTLTVQ